ncbi:hypothetical protein AALP_AA1G110500 [Arabis alpina]|uniref:Pentatricopeptide repeat-containing protein n=1 Tax=Arabis alpina TaxID=50452 RepID=A0A087HMH6_ARAAL|nr:hypothetical protein AALP_AA1G110500 [Arabis alpina]
MLIRASGSHHLWKRAYTTVPSPAPMAANKMFDELQNLTGFYLDHITSEQEKNGTSLSEAVIAGWANRLSSDGKHGQALEIYEWMEKRKMKFSPSQFAHFAEVMGKLKGDVAVNDLFKNLDPHFHKMDSSELKNWLPYKNLLEFKSLARLELALKFSKENLASSVKDSALSEKEDSVSSEEEDSASSEEDLEDADPDTALSEEELENAGPDTPEWRRHYGKSPPRTLEPKGRDGKPRIRTMEWLKMENLV